MKKLLVATTNPAKLAEYKIFLADLPVEIVGLADVGIKNQAPEEGETFEDNALLKAIHYGKQARMVTLADDGGFEIEALNGEPGVKSHRWLGYETADDEELINAVVERMKGIPTEKRSARMRTVLAITDPNGEAWTFEEATEGVVPEQPSPTRIKGYPFRPVFYLPQFAKCYVDLDEGELRQASQRWKLVERALPTLKKLLKV